MATYPGEDTYPSSSTYPSGVPLPPGFRWSISAEPANNPPRFRITISDTRARPATSVTITRRDPDGRQYPVRTADGGPLPLSGGQATIFDYEAPFGTTLEYTVDVGGARTILASLDVGDIWLIHIGVPARSVKLTEVFELGDDERDTTAGVFQILDRDDPIVVSSGSRPAASATLGVRTTTDAERRAMHSILDDDSPLLLNIPSTLSWGVDPCYVSIGAVRAPRAVQYGPVGLRNWSMPYRIISRPGGGTQAAITWQDIVDMYASWQAIIDAGVLAWTQLAAPTS